MYTNQVSSARSRTCWTSAEVLVPTSIGKGTHRFVCLCLPLTLPSARMAAIHECYSAALPLPTLHDVIRPSWGVTSDSSSPRVLMP